MKLASGATLQNEPAFWNENCFKNVTFISLFVTSTYPLAKRKINRERYICMYKYVNNAMSFNFLINY
jgi:hypothetical protein